MIEIADDVDEHQDMSSSERPWALKPIHDPGTPLATRGGPRQLRRRKSTMARLARGVQPGAVFGSVHDRAREILVVIGNLARRSSP